MPQGGLAEEDVWPEWRSQGSIIKSKALSLTVCVTCPLSLGKRREATFKLLPAGEREWRGAEDEQASVSFSFGFHYNTKRSKTTRTLRSFLSIMGTNNDKYIKELWLFSSVKLLSSPNSESWTLMRWAHTTGRFPITFVICSQDFIEFTLATDWLIIYGGVLDLAPRLDLFSWFRTRRIII